MGIEKSPNGGNDNFKLSEEDQSIFDQIVSTLEQESPQTQENNTPSDTNPPRETPTTQEAKIIQLFPHQRRSSDPEEYPKHINMIAVGIGAIAAGAITYQAQRYEEHNNPAAEGAGVGALIIFAAATAGLIRSRRRRRHR